ncbi:uncharacterized protein LOC134297995 [Anolis carolinensis]|uniref:uncharacterized protein LOC134297995 n=1 Tax=Anolis carolinensis TaxID=28377 RepID=UPI002F2B4400
MPPKKNVGGPKGKGPANKIPAKRPPPPSGPATEDEDSAQLLRVLVARIEALEREKAAAAAAEAQKAGGGSNTGLIKSLFSRISALEGERSAAVPVTDASLVTSTPVAAEAVPSTSAAAAEMRSAVSALEPTLLASRRRVLICGHSYVHWAERQARRGPYGQHLGLASLAFVEWRGRRGLRWEGLLPLLFGSGVRFPPDLIVMHLGGNDLGLLKGRALFLQVLNDMHKIQEVWPHTGLAWSAIIPRPRWPYGDGKKLDKARKRVNRALRKVLENGMGYYIPHDTIRFNDSTMYRTDGIHLSELGNQIFLADLQKGIREILSNLVGVRS